MSYVIVKNGRLNDYYFTGFLYVVYEEFARIELNFLPLIWVEARGSSEVFEFDSDQGPRKYPSVPFRLHPSQCQRAMFSLPF